MADIHAHCSGCNEIIEENDRDIVIVGLGRAQIMGNEMGVEIKWELWYGHEKCFIEAFGEYQDQLDLPNDVEREELYNEGHTK